MPGVSLVPRPHPPFNVTRRKSILLKLEVLATHCLLYARCQYTVSSSRVLHSSAFQMRGHTRSLNTCRLRAIKSVPGRFQVKRHSRALEHQAFPLSACNIERWVWPGDEATWCLASKYNYLPYQTTTIIYIVVSCLATKVFISK